MAEFQQLAIDTLTLKQGLNFDCWLGRLEAFGGLKQLKALLPQINPSLYCDCATPFLSTLSEFLGKSKGQADVIELVQTYSQIVADGLATQFSEANWNRTISDANSRCLEEPTSISSLTYPPLEDQTSPYVLFALMMFATMFWWLLGCCCMIASSTTRSSAQNRHHLSRSFDAPIAFSKHLKGYSKFTVLTLLLSSFGLLLYIVIRPLVGTDSHGIS